MGRYKRGIFFGGRTLATLRGIKEEPSPSVLSLNKPTKVDPNGRRVRLSCQDYLKVKLTHLK